MSKEERKLFLFDIDGTLFDNEHNEVPNSTLVALQELAQKHDICIATGRARFMLYSIEALLPYVKYFILINGRYVLEKEKVLFEEPMPVSMLEKLIKDLEELHIAYGFEGSDDEAISRIDEKVI
ncbi:MAG TPA: HAD hydrolase family protein, partial [Bacilli bacterium]